MANVENYVGLIILLYLCLLSLLPSPSLRGVIQYSKIVLVGGNRHIHPFPRHYSTCFHDILEENRLHIYYILVGCSSASIDLVLSL
jgi:hypothetical protein